MHQALFLLLPAFHLASGFAVPDGALLPNASTVTGMTHHSDAAEAAEKVVEENESKGPSHNIRMFLIIFGVIIGFLCLSVAFFFMHALLSKRRYNSGGKKKKRGRRGPLSKLPRDRRGSTDSDIWGLSNNRRSLGTTVTREKGSGSWREEMIPPHGHVYQEVPTEEAGREPTSYTYHPPQYPGPNSLALEERYAPYEGRPNTRDSRGSMRTMDSRVGPVVPMDVI